MSEGSKGYRHQRKDEIVFGKALGTSTFHVLYNSQALKEFCAGDSHVGRSIAMAGAHPTPSSLSRANLRKDEMMIDNVVCEI